ncbi:hypothetical protein RUM43_014453 [Polyplax serrata]|uniref:Uncharacterized protein n=1 Tax=Polyplax serrata TaxID=468196 RepID=A0AAN8S6T6_POLSC
MNVNCRKSPPVLTVCNDKGIPTEIEFEDEKKEESGGGGGGFHEILRNVGRRFSQPFGSHLRSKSTDRRNSSGSTNGGSRSPFAKLEKLSWWGSADLYNSKKGSKSKDPWGSAERIFKDSKSSVREGSKEQPRWWGSAEWIFRSGKKKSEEVWWGSQEFGLDKDPGKKCYLSPDEFAENRKTVKSVQLFGLRKNSKNKFKSSGEKNDEMEGKQSPRISSEDSKPARFPLGRLSAKTEKFLQHNVRYLNACSDETKRISNSHTSSAKGRKLSCFLEVPKPDGFAGTTNSKEFRVRSKSLDDGDKRFYTDCETTYRIYETIVKEGALLRRSSLDPERRRLSLGPVNSAHGPHRASDAFLDPHHAAILFRDSRGLPVADPFLEKVNLSDLAKLEFKLGDEK